MPIRKFRSLSEADKIKRFRPGTEEFSHALRSVFGMAAILAPHRLAPPGVFKFRSIEEAQDWNKSWKRPTRPSIESR